VKKKILTMKSNYENELKIVRRIGMPETNSSSSHAVSISMCSGNIVCPGDSDWDIEITEDGILKIPGGKDFGWEYFKTNSVLTKLQYLCGIYCYDIRTDHGKKSIVRLKKILKEIFGVRDVEFLWITDFSNRLKEVEDPEDAYYDYPEIDHNSHDIFEEITENLSVIRAFLLSRDSWLYGGNDNSSPPDGFYNEPISKSRVNAILSVELGGKIGRVDWEVRDLFDRVGKDVIKRTLTNDDEFNVLGETYYDLDTKAWVEGEKDLKELMEGNLLTFFSYSLYQKDQKFYILYTNHTFNNVWMEIKKEEVGQVYSGFDWNMITQKAIDQSVEGKDYIILPLKIKLLEYGDYEI
jgi:hypothetical protein